MSEDFYAILKVPRDAPRAAIRLAYLKLARIHHPDRNPGIDAAHFKRIVRAYEVLRSAELRRRYDASPDHFSEANQAPWMTPSRARPQPVTSRPSIWVLTRSSRSARFRRRALGLLAFAMALGSFVTMWRLAQAPARIAGSSDATSPVAFTASPLVRPIATDSGSSGRSDPQVQPVASEQDLEAADHDLAAAQTNADISASPPKALGDQSVSSAQSGQAPAGPRDAALPQKPAIFAVDPAARLTPPRIRPSDSLHAHESALDSGPHWQLVGGRADGDARGGARQNLFDELLIGSDSIRIDSTDSGLAPLDSQPAYPWDRQADAEPFTDRPQAESFGSSWPTSRRPDDLVLAELTGRRPRADAVDRPPVGRNATRASGSKLPTDAPQPLDTSSAARKVARGFHSWTGPLQPSAAWPPTTAPGLGRRFMFEPTGTPTLGATPYPPSAGWSRPTWNPMRFATTPSFPPFGISQGSSYAESGLSSAGLPYFSAGPHYSTTWDYPADAESAWGADAPMGSVPAPAYFPSPPAYGADMPTTQPWAAPPAQVPLSIPTTGQFSNWDQPY